MSKTSCFLFLTLFLFLSSFSNAQNNKKLIVFSSDAASNNKQQIYLMEEDGSNLRQVTNIDIKCTSPRFSPDGEKIVFVGSHPVSDYLYLIDLKDSSTFSFPIFLDGGKDPVFSPDGGELIYHSEKMEDNAVYLMELETDSSYMISDGSMSSHAEFSPDGYNIIYTSAINDNMDLVVLDLADTTDDAQKTIASSQDAELYGTFSPDGKLVAYASFDSQYKGTVHVCNADGTSNKAISKGMGSSYNPKFSPDGKHLAFISDKTGKLEIYICNPDGSGMKQLTNKDGYTAEFSWSSDGKKIVYENRKESVSSINIIDIESGTVTNLTGENANNINPDIQK
jgi:TolB protein